MSATVLKLLSPPEQERAGAKMSLQPATLIVVSDPALFERTFAERLGVDVFVVSTAQAAIELLPQYGWTHIYADYRQLEGVYRGSKWSGLSLLREVKSQIELKRVSFFLLMEQGWQAQQNDWVVQQGAKGIIRRSPAVVARSMAETSGGSPTSHTAGSTFKLADSQAIEAHFLRFAGPLHELAIQVARRKLEDGAVASSRDAYIEALAAQLSVGGQAAAFRAAVSALQSVEKMPYTAGDQPTEAWIEAVNVTYKTFAGALGASLVIQRTLAELTKDASLTRTRYVELLSSRLTNTDRRAEFLAALNRERLWPTQSASQGDIA